MAVFKIESIYDALLWSGEATSLRDAVEQAVRSGASLVGARLDGARLDRARLDGASLVGASLVGASLVGARLDRARLDGARLDGASLVGASLVGARLDGASLVGARLDGARLDRARLDGARLDGASLVGASLVGARLVGASLVGARLDGARLDRARLDGARLDGARLDRASLDPIRSDLYEVLAAAPSEVAGLLAALREGRVDGSQYEGECACLVGTIANLRHEPHNALTIGLRPDSTRSAEVWFLAIQKGDTPATNPVAAITVGWVEQWLTEQGKSVPTHATIFWTGDYSRLVTDMTSAGVEVSALLTALAPF